MTDENLSTPPPIRRVAEGPGGGGSGLICTKGTERTHPPVRSWLHGRNHKRLVNLRECVFQQSVGSTVFFQNSSSVPPETREGLCMGTSTELQEGSRKHHNFFSAWRRSSIVFWPFYHTDELYRAGAQQPVRSLKALDVICACDLLKSFHSKAILLPDGSQMQNYKTVTAPLNTLSRPLDLLFFCSSVITILDWYSGGGISTVFHCLQ